MDVYGLGSNGSIERISDSKEDQIYAANQFNKDNSLIKNAKGFTVGEQGYISKNTISGSFKDSKGNITELKDIFKGEVLEEDKFVVKQYELNKKVLNEKDNIQIISYNRKSEIISKEIILLDNKMRKVESILFFLCPMIS